MKTFLAQPHNSVLRENASPDSRAPSLSSGQMGEWEWDIATGKVTWSPVLKALFGLPEEAEIQNSQNVLGCIHPEDRADFEAAVEAAVAGPHTLAASCRIVWPNGAVRRLACLGHVVRDRDDGVAGLSGVGLDVTDQHDAEEEIQARERRMQTIADNVPVLIARVDTERRYVFANRAYEDMLGLSLAQVVGHSMWEVLGPKAYETIRGYVDRALAGEKVVYEAWIEYAVVGTRRMHGSYVPEFGLDGAVTGFLLSTVDVTAQREAAEANQRLAQMVEQSQDAIIGTAPDGTIQSWNKGAAQIYGYSAQEAVGRSVAMLHPTEDLPLMEERLARLRRGEELPSYEAVRVRKDGVLRQVAVTVSLVRNSQGELVSHSAISRDITAQKEAEGAMRRLSLIVEQSQDAIIGTAPDGTIQSWNKGAVRLFGYTAAETVGRPLAEFQPTGEAENVPAILDALRRGEDIPAFEAVRVRKDGPARQVAVTISAIRGADGEVTGHASIVRDITAQKEAEAASRRLAQMVESSHDAIVSIALDGTILSWNHGAARLYGYTAQEAIGQTVAIFYPNQDMTPFRPQLEKLARGEEIPEYEAVRLVKDGREVPLSVTLSAVRDSQGIVRNFAAIFRDISERKALEAERERLLAEATDRADRDPLTGLLNHRAFHHRLEEEAERCVREGTFLAVAMLDINNFKFFNDSYGHPFGDQALRRVAEALQQSCRSYDTLARFGGDEFAVLMPGREQAETTEIAARLASRLKGIAILPPGSAAEVPLELTMGVAIFPEADLSRLDAVALADRRLYQAKTGENIAALTEPHRDRFCRAVEGFAMLDALVTAVDGKDRVTRRHAGRVLHTALALAQTLGLDEAASDTLAQAALLQEIGKIGIPDRILRKPGPLTGAEYETLKQHCDLGAILIGSVPPLARVVEIVRHHHEHWDGGGYQSGRRGEEIPLLARLLSVADAYSALTSDRPYRKALTDEAARAALQAGAGSQWDPACIRAFLEPNPSAAL